MAILNRKQARTLIQDSGKRASKDALDMLEGKVIHLIRKAINNANGAKTVMGGDVAIIDFKLLV